MNAQRFQDLFFSYIQASPKNSLADRLDLLNQAVISFYMDLCPLQDSLRYRARCLGLTIAGSIIDGGGNLNLERLGEVRQLLEKGFYPIGPGFESDALLYRHLDASLKKLSENGEYWNWIQKFSTPLCFKKAEELIRETLWPEPIRVVQTVHVRRAVLAAWLTFLRQTTGSCFATAPAIAIQQDYPLRFLKDLYDLLATGRLKRILGGKEYAVPLSLNLGAADLQKPLRAFSSLDSLAYSPGLMAALEAGGVLAPEKPIKSKVDELRRLFTKREVPETPEKLIRSILLETVGITEEDVEDEQHLARIQMTPLLAKQTAVYYQRPSERSLKVSEWKKRFAKACSAFYCFTDCALLRSWEYTIASFCDVKIDFARWNLYVGLGFDAQQKGGIGAFLYQFIGSLLEHANEDVQRYHREYEQAVAAVRALETMIYNSAGDAHRAQLRSELSGYMHSANSTLESRNKAAEKAEALADFFNSLMRQFDQKLQVYFQELFDPGLIGEEGHLYDDSLAGFRLVYKHGREDASQWTVIRSGEEYINCLRDFFSTVELDIEAPPSLGREIVSQITTALIRHVQESEFLELALLRSQEKGRRSPWEYISGGTMETLIQAYCGRDRPFTEQKIVPHSAEQLLHFLIKNGAHKSEPLLIHSPTHAFLFYPSLLSQNSDVLLELSRKATQKWKYDELMQEHIAHKLSAKLVEQERPLFLHLYRQKALATTSIQMRQHLIEALQMVKSAQVKNPTALVDSVLYEQSPLLPASLARSALKSLLKQISSQYSISTDQIEREADLLGGSFVGPWELQQAAKTIVLGTLREPYSEVDWDMKIAIAARQMELCYPHPLIFADTNWSGWFFGFIANPITGILELWRLNRAANQGFPMSDWQEWLSPKNTAQWILLSEPQEYFGSFL